jgi:hypothetical protein
LAGIEVLTMRVAVSAVAVLMIWLLSAGPLCGNRDAGPDGRAAGPAGAGESPPAAGVEAESRRDTLFTAWFSNPPYESGFHFVEVDDVGDTLALFLRWIMGEHPHIRLMGPLGGTNKTNRRRLWGLHRLEIQNVGQIFSRAEDFCTKGGNGTIENVSLRKVKETPDEVCWEQTWRFIKHDLSIRDTLDILRQVRMNRGRPYFLVKYEFTWVNPETDSLRFIWHFQRQTRFGRLRSLHEVGVAPGYGMVTRRHAFEASDLGYLACVMTAGNPLATKADTLADGSSSYMASELKRDFGSGTPGFAAGFIRFNPEYEIVPSEFAWIDTSGHYVTTLNADSLRVRVDTTNVLDGLERYFFARSDFVVFQPGETKTMEYAVGRAIAVEDSAHTRLQLSVPDVVWFDGTLSRQPIW